MISYRKTTVAKHAAPVQPLLLPPLALVFSCLPFSLLLLFSLKLHLHFVTKSNEFKNFLFLLVAVIFLTYFVFTVLFFFRRRCCFSVVLCHSVYPFGLVGVRGWDLASKALITMPTRQSSLLHEQPASASVSDQSEPISIQRFGCSKKREEKKIPLRRNCVCVCV